MRCAQLDAGGGTGAAAGTAAVRADRNPGQVDGLYVLVERNPYGAGAQVHVRPGRVNGRREPVGLYKHGHAGHGMHCDRRRIRNRRVCGNVEHGGERAGADGADGGRL